MASCNVIRAGTTGDENHDADGVIADVPDLRAGITRVRVFSFIVDRDEGRLA